MKEGKKASTPSEKEKYDAQAQADTYTSEDYQGVMRLVAILDGGMPTMYDAECLEEAAAWKIRGKKDPTAPGFEADDDYRHDGYPILDNRPEEEREGGIYYSCEDARKNNKKLHSPWRQVVSRVAWLEEGWFQCLISRTKPEGVKAENIACVKLLDIDVGGPGALYFTGPPSEFWMWNVEKFEEKEVDNIRMVLAEIVGVSAASSFDFGLCVLMRTFPSQY